MAGGGKDNLMMERKNLLVLFGGQSSEHEVSCISVQNFVKNIDTDRYDVTLVGITKTGHWVLAEDISRVADGSWRESKISAVLSPDAESKCLYLMDGAQVKSVKIDAAVPVLHGLYGEDGTLQGLFSLAGIPFAGCGVLSSAVAMDKVFTKLVVEKLGIRQASYVALHRYELKNIDEVIGRIEAKLSYPIFVKPSCAGSSVGVSRAEDREGLAKALHIAAAEDSKILCEETIVGRELECAVLGTDTDVMASGIGEILAAAEFYDYNAKYNSPESRTVVDPELPAGIREEIRTDAVRIFRALDGFGLSRVDFFLDEKGVVFNEINTFPGFTGISMYPVLMENAGVSKKELVGRLIDMAFDRKEH